MYRKLEVEYKYTHLHLCRGNYCICRCSGDNENQVTAGSEIMAEIFNICVYNYCLVMAHVGTRTFTYAIFVIFSVFIKLVKYNLLLVWDEIIPLRIIWSEFQAINSRCLAYSVWKKVLILMLVNISWEVYFQLWNIGLYASLSTPLNMMPVIYKMYDQVQSNMSQFTGRPFGKRPSVIARDHSHYI